MIVDFFKERRIVNSIKISMNSLLGFLHSDFIDTIWKSYPHIKTSVVKRYKEGEDSSLIACNHLLIVFCDLIEKCSDTQKKEIFENLKNDNLGLSKLESLIRLFLNSVSRQVDLGKLNEDSFDLVIGHILDASEGKNSAKRYKDGLTNALNKALLK